MLIGRHRGGPVWLAVFGGGDSPYVYPTVPGMVDLLPLFSSDEFGVYGSLRVANGGGASADAMIDTVTIAGLFDVFAPFNGLRVANVGGVSDDALIDTLVNDPSYPLPVPYIA